MIGLHSYGGLRTEFIARKIFYIHPDIWEYSLYLWLCYRKWLMLFFLKFQRDNRKNVLAVAPAKGKTGEKGCIFNVLWR